MNEDEIFDRNLEAMYDIRLSEGATMETVKDLVIEIVARLRLLQSPPDSTVTLRQLMEKIERHHQQRAEEFFETDLPRNLDSPQEDDLLDIARSNEANSLALLKLVSEVLARLRTESFPSLFEEILRHRGDLYQASREQGDDESENEGSS